MGDDESVITKRRGLLTLPQVTRRKLDGPDLAGIVIEECAQLEGSGGTIGSIVIELDGPGVSCYDTLRRTKYAPVLVGVHTGARLQDNKNYNVKARLWRAGLDYLKVGGNSMPVDPELKSQLPSVRYSYKDGVLLMESKKEYKKRMGKSPDRADSWILTFGERIVTKEKKTVTHQYAPVSGGWMG
jgi:hypothetical protein